MALKKIGCKTKGGCLVTILVFIISIVLLSGVSFGFLSDYAYKNALKQLGFNSEKEFEEFSDKMNVPFDDSEILINMPTEIDAGQVNSILSTSITLSNGQDVLLSNGKLNIEAIEDSEELIVNNTMNFTPRELAYAINLIITSSEIDDVEMVSDLELKQIDYLYIDNQNARFNFYIDINTADIKKEIGKLGSFIPERLLLNVQTILTIEESQFVASYCDIKINDLDTETNEKFLEILGNLMNKEISEVEQWTGDLIVSIFYDFLTALNCNMTFNSDIITITKVTEGE